MNTTTKTLLATLVLTAALAGNAIAATVFDDGGADNFVTNADNWDNGLPVGQQGTIGINATTSANEPALDGYDILHTDGVIGYSGISSISLTNGASWVTNGATASTSTNHRGFNVSGGSSFTLVNGTINTASGRDWSVSDTDSSLTINGGELNLGRHLLFSGTSSIAGSTFTISGGKLTSTTGDIGARHFSDNLTTFNFNGGTTSVVNLDLQGNNTLFVFGGSTAGSLSAGGLLNANVASGFGTNSNLNFLSGTGMSLSLTGADQAFYEDLYANNFLRFNDSNAEAFAANFQVSGDTLSVIPEPSTFALLGLAGLAALFISRRR